MAILNQPITAILRSEQPTTIIAKEQTVQSITLGLNPFALAREQYSCTNPTLIKAATPPKVHPPKKIAAPAKITITKAEIVLINKVLRPLDSVEAAVVSSFDSLLSGKCSCFAAESSDSLVIFIDFI